MSRVKNKISLSYLSGLLYSRLAIIIGSSLFLKLTFAWFIIQGIFFALTVKVGLPPDENYHLTFIRLFSENNLSPFLSHQNGYFSLGEVTRTPFFIYHYMFSLPYLILSEFPYSYIALRFLNLFISLGTLLLVMKIADSLKLSRVVRNLSIFMLTNTLMFTFLASAVSYDNLFIFLSLACFLLLLHLLNRITALKALLFALVIGAGVLVKINFLVIAAIAVTILLASYRGRYKLAIQRFRKSFSYNYKLNLFLCIPISLLAVLIVHRFGYNIITYQALTPSCTQVMTIEDCRQNGLFVRNEEVYGVKRQQTKKNTFEYVYDWVPLMQERIYGIFSHREMRPNKVTFYWAQAFIVLAAVSIIRLWKQTDKRLTIALGMALFYCAVLLLENHSIYNASGRFTFVVHGRYIFAVLPLLYLIANHYILRLLKNGFLGSLFLVMTLTIFAVSGVPKFLFSASNEWYKATPAIMLQKARDSLR